MEKNWLMLQNIENHRQEWNDASHDALKKFEMATWSLTGLFAAMIHLLSKCQALLSLVFEG